MTIPADIKVYPHPISLTQYTVTIEPTDATLKTIATFTSATCTVGPLDTGTLTFPFMQQAYDYFFNNYSDGIVADLNTDAGSTVYHIGERYYLDISMINTFVQKTPFPATHITDSVTNAPTNAATNAASDNPTNYDLLSGILGVAGGLNNANAKQNAMAVIVNANATKQNAGFAILNTLAGKVNLNLDILETNGLMAA